MQNQQGFTLVELAIVLMIIGLLIGGILRGQELIENARVTATAQQVTAYNGAIVTFRDIYGGLPGDIGNARKRLSGCTSANNCYDGNNDGVIGDLVADAYGNEPWRDVTNAITSENTQFWKHLAMAKLISGVNPVADTPDWGSTHPTSRMGGGFFARYANMNIPPYTPLSGTMLILRNQISGAWICSPGAAAGYCVIAPVRAAQIDRKMDDGRAMFGSVWAASANWTSGCGMPNSSGQNASGYDETSERKACDMMFKIH